MAANSVPIVDIPSSNASGSYFSALRQAETMHLLSCLRLHLLPGALLAALLGRVAVLGMVTLLLCACSTARYPLNVPLERVDFQTGHRLTRTLGTDSDDRFFMQVAISGGGARAAALGFGVLETLRDTRVRWEGKDKSLLDELDVLQGVSGGSMLAAYYALHGVEGLQRFHDIYFKPRLQSELVGGMLSPRNLWRMQSRWFGRGDLLAEFLDERLFEGATFGDLSRSPRKPFLAIHASDMSSGARFEFTQEQFDYLCSDLDGMPLARAVAASSAAPLVLSPITLKNHTDLNSGAACGEPIGRTLSRSAGPLSPAFKHFSRMEAFRMSNADGLLRPYVHLLDGGLSDNVGAYGPMDTLAPFGGAISTVRSVGYRSLRRIVYIVVNAETTVLLPKDRSGDVPGPIRTALALADIPIARNSVHALAAKRALIPAWRAEVEEAHARGDFDVFPADAKFYLIEVNLDDALDLDLRDKLRAIPTSLQLDPEEVSRLRQHAAEALRSVPDFQRLLNDMRD